MNDAAAEKTILRDEPQRDEPQLSVILSGAGRPKAGLRSRKIPTFSPALSRCIRTSRSRPQSLEPPTFAFSPPPLYHSHAQYGHDHSGSKTRRNSLIHHQIAPRSQRIFLSCNGSAGGGSGHVWLQLYHRRASDSSNSSATLGSLRARGRVYGLAGIVPDAIRTRAITQDRVA